MWSAEMLEEITSLAHEVGGWSKLEQLLREAERQERPWPHTCEPTCAHDLKSYNSGGEYWLCRRHFPWGLWDARAVQGAADQSKQSIVVPLIAGGTAKFLKCN